LNKIVGILTLLERDYNLGSVLQAYALQHTISSLGLDSYIIDFWPSKNLFVQGISVAKEKGLKYFITRAIRFNMNLFSTFAYEKKKKINISNFMTKNIRFTNSKFKNIEELKKLNFDIYIVGSDMVWSPKYTKELLEVYLLCFVEKGIKVSYAASGEMPISKELFPLYKKHLQSFNYVSVREKSFAKYIRECTRSEPEVVVDPTALLTEEDWMKMAKKPKKELKNPYILVYDLYRSKEILPRVTKVAKRKNWEIVAYNPNVFLHSLVYRLRILTFYTCNPPEFLWLIKNAEYVITSSFHGTVYSVLFKKPFYSINPEPHAPVSRIRDFLEEVSLEDRLVEDPKFLPSLIFEEVEFSNAEKKIERMKKRSIKFLKKAVGLK
jgi:hypothetical protein